MIAHIGGTRKETVMEHNKKVAMYAEKLGSEIGMPKICFLAGYFHDMGKFTEAFCNYIEEAVKTGKRKNRPVHSTAGGKYVYEKYGNGDKYRQLTATQSE
jgi:CRISPR-associated endonuclease/helicase Cas3